MNNIQAGIVLGTADFTALVSMGLAAIIAAGSFSIIARYLFDCGLADPNAPAPEVLAFYKAYIAHTKKKTGRIGGAFWVHCISAGIFITTGVVYTIVRFVLPRFL